MVLCTGAGEAFSQAGGVRYMSSVARDATLEGGLALIALVALGETSWGAGC